MTNIHQIDVAPLQGPKGLQLKAELLLKTPQRELLRNTRSRNLQADEIDVVTIDPSLGTTAPIIHQNHKSHLIFPRAT